jgi:hypothetical protein
MLPRFHKQSHACICSCDERTDADILPAARGPSEVDLASLPQAVVRRAGSFASVVHPVFLERLDERVVAGSGERVVLSDADPEQLELLSRDS